MKLAQTENEISYKIRGAIFEVYNQLGPGLLESVYQKALKFELTYRGCYVQEEVPMKLNYKGIEMTPAFRADLIIENKVIIEIKSVEYLLDVHHKQLITYLKLSGLHLGILVNFNTDDINDSIYRKVNNLSEGR
jgi:GxxExxY protein